MLAIDAQGSAGASAAPFWISSIEIASGVRMKAIRPSRGGRLMTTPAFCSLVASRVDVVDGIGEMAEIAPAGIDLRVPVVGELHQRRLRLFRVLGVAGRGEEDQGVTALLVARAPHLDEAELADEKGQRRLEIADANHGVQIFHGHGSFPVCVDAADRA